MRRVRALFDGWWWPGELEDLNRFIQAVGVAMKCRAQREASRLSPPSGAGLRYVSLAGTETYSVRNRLPDAPNYRSSTLD